MSDFSFFLLAVVWGFMLGVAVVLMRHELWNLAVRTKDAIVEVVPFVRFLYVGAVTRWRIATLSKRDLEWTLSLAYLHVDDNRDEDDDRAMRNLDSIASTIAKGGVEPLGSVKSRMVENGHHDRYYWKHRSIEWPEEEG